MKYPIEKRIEVVTKVMALGNMRLVAELTGVSYGLIRIWKGQPWWSDMVAEIRASRNVQVDNKLSKIVDKSLEMISDRLENGDVKWNWKKQEIERVPLSALSINKIANDALTQQQVIQKAEQNQHHQETQVSINEHIKQLAAAFAAFNTNRTIDVVAKEVYALHDKREEGLQEATEVRWEAGEHSESERGQQSSEDDGEGWESAQGGWEGRGPHQAAEQGWEDDEEQPPSSEPAYQPFLPA